MMQAKPASLPHYLTLAEELLFVAEDDADSLDLAAACAHRLGDARERLLGLWPAGACLLSRDFAEYAPALCSAVTAVRQRPR